MLAVGERRQAAAWAYCREVLPKVSRTFALTIPVLPEPLSDTVTVAYLMCRIADTIEDRTDVDAADREALFDDFLVLARNPGDEKARRRLQARWPDAPADPADAVYQDLMRNAGKVLDAYGSLPPAAVRPILDTVEEMVEGMREMMRRPRGSAVVVARDFDDLERYCHYVAGTVGIMLTRLFADHLGPEGEALVTPERLEQGRRFGLGLQLTNILKDHRVDLQRGVSFFPQSWIEGPEGRRTLTRRARGRLMDATLFHLREAQEYVLSIPASAPGIRLFCLWALWMAVTTVREVARSTELHPRIERREVEEIVAFSQQHVHDDVALRRRFARYHEEAARAATLMT